MITIETYGVNLAWTVYRANCVAIGKTPRPDKVLTVDWCMEQLHAQDSTLEQAHLYIFDSACRGDVTSHIVRHTKGHPRPVVESWRPDWTGKPRPSSDTPRQFLECFTPYSLIEVMRQRLCVRAERSTREWGLRVKEALCTHSDVLLQALGVYCMPDCEYRGDVCHQPSARACGRYPHWSNEAGAVTLKSATPKT